VALPHSLKKFEFAMTTSTKKSLVFVELQQKIMSQFKGLDPNDPSVWPSVPKYGLCLLVALGVIVAAWFVWLRNSQEELRLAQEQEESLKQAYKQKLIQAANLETLKKQREQVQQFVIQLEKQLPSKAEIDALLSDISQAGLSRNLQLDVIRPGTVVVQKYYAELPIALKIVGKYHDIGAFAGDMAHLSRIVTLNNMSLTPARDGNLFLEATAKTYRYLDPEEAKTQAKTPVSAAGDKK
jgi:type IV pilus assembly protein PilO